MTNHVYAEDAISSTSGCASKRFGQRCGYDRNDPIHKLSPTEGTPEPTATPMEGIKALRAKYKDKPWPPEGTPEPVTPQRAQLPELDVTEGDMASTSEALELLDAQKYPGMKDNMVRMTVCGYMDRLFCRERQLAAALAEIGRVKADRNTYDSAHKQQAAKTLQLQTQLAALQVSHDALLLIAQRWKLYSEQVHCPSPEVAADIAAAEKLTRRKV